MTRETAHYLLTPQHLKDTVWVALRTPSREGLIGAVVRRRKVYHTEPIDDLGIKSGPHETRDAAVRALIDHAQKQKSRRKG